MKISDFQRIKPFQLHRYSIPQWIFIALLIACMLGAIFFFSKDNFPLGVVVLILPFPIVYLTYVFHKPEVGFISLLYANYFAVGLSRYLPGPLGLSVDALLVLTWLSVIFSQFNRKIEWNKALNGFVIVAIIWFSYTLFQLFNPEAVSKVAWFYAMRGVSLYMLLTLPLVFVLFNKSEHLDTFIKLWAWFTIVAVLKGAQQKIMGPDPWENAWLDAGGGKTHRLPGGLRVFSFFPDAATYGGSMGFASVMFAILSLNTQETKKKFFFLFVACFALYGMLISGTRGAIAVPFGGFALYAFLNRKIKVIVFGAIALGSVYGILKFTTIGDSVYEIRRFRDALDNDNPSMMVREENKKKFKAYLSTRPFGGGIGSAGNWGLRFTPGTFLAETPPDGWYVQIWAEQGIVGLMLHLSILLYILIRCCYIIMFKLKNIKYKGIAAAFASGMFGVMGASYTSNALGQMPNGIIIFVSVSFILLMMEWEKDEEQEELP